MTLCYIHRYVHASGILCFVAAWCFGNGCDTPSTCRIIIVNAIAAAPHWRGAVYKCTAQLLLGLRAQLLLWVLYVRLQAGLASPCI
jgi:hypothetical protein